MATLIHLCRKDYSFAKHALWGAWAVFLVAALTPALITGALVDAAAAFIGFSFAAPLFLIFAATLRIFRADSFTGGNAFIGTRPVTMTLLGLSKLIGIAAFVLLPYLVAQVIGVFALRLHLTPADWMLFLAEKKLLFGLPAAIALIVGTHTRNFVWSTMLTILCGAMMVWLSASIFGSPGGWNVFVEDSHLMASQWLVAQALVSTTAILLAWLWIAHRSLAWSIGAGAFAIAVIAGVSKHWKVNFVTRLAFPEVEAPAAANDLHITWLGGAHIYGSSHKNVPFTTVVREAKVKSVPDTWTAGLSDVRSKAIFRDGGIITSEAVNSPYYGDYSRVLMQSLGVRLPQNHPEGRGWSRFSTWFEAETSLLRDRTDKICTISGECMVELQQFVVLANLPAESGASASHGRFRYRIEQVEATPNGISVKLAARGVDLASRGKREHMKLDIEIVLVNSRTREHTVLGQGQGIWDGGPGWMIMHHSLSIDAWPNGEASDPYTFLKDARLYLIDPRHGGTVRLPFEMPEIELKPGP